MSIQPFDLRRGYYHMTLTEESRAKSTSVIPLGKFEFICCHFGLAHAPAYFQCLICEVFKGLEIAFSYFYDKLI